MTFPFPKIKPSSSSLARRVRGSSSLGRGDPSERPRRSRAGPGSPAGCAHRSAPPARRFRAGWPRRLLTWAGTAAGAREGRGPRRGARGRAHPCAGGAAQRRRERAAAAGSPPGHRQPRPRRPWSPSPKTARARRPRSPAGALPPPAGWWCRSGRRRAPCVPPSPTCRSPWLSSASSSTPSCRGWVRSSTSPGRGGRAAAAVQPGRGVPRRGAAGRASAGGGECSPHLPLLYRGRRPSLWGAGPRRGGNFPRRRRRKGGGKEGGKEPTAALRRKVLRRERGAVAACGVWSGSWGAAPRRAICPRSPAPRGSVRAARKGCGLRRSRRAPWGGTFLAAGERCPGRGEPARPPRVPGGASPCDSARQRPVSGLWGLSIPALSQPSGGVRPDAGNPVVHGKGFSC